MEPLSLAPWRKRTRRSDRHCDSHLGADGDDNYDTVLGKTWALQIGRVFFTSLFTAPTPPAWAVDSAGKVWMRLGDISSALDRETGAVPVWTPVESASGASTNVAFSRVSASCSGQMVWAIGAEDGGEVYARLVIYADFRLGVEWVSCFVVLCHAIFRIQQHY